MTYIRNPLKTGNIVASALYPTPISALLNCTTVRHCSREQCTRRSQKLPLPAEREDEHGVTCQPSCGSLWEAYASPTSYAAILERLRAAGYLWFRKSRGVELLKSPTLSDSRLHAGSGPGDPGTEGCDGGRGRGGLGHRRASPEPVCEQCQRMSATVDPGRSDHLLRPSRWPGLRDSHVRQSLRSGSFRW